MRKQLVTLGLVILTLAAVSLACKFNTGNNNNNSNNSNNSNNTTASPTPSTSKNSGTSTPTETFKTFYNAVKNKDVAAFKTVLPKKTLDEMGERAKTQNKSLDDFLRDGILNEMADDLPPSLPETRNEKIDGDHATIEFMEKGKWSTGKMVKEGDSWKIT